MLSTLLLSAMLAPAAPVPKDAPTSGPAPVIVELKPETDGALKLFVNRKQKGVVSVNVVDPKGGPPVTITAPLAPTVTSKVPLSEIKDLKIFTAAGKEVKVADAVEQLKAGGVVVISTDGKKVDPFYARAFKDDILVLVSPELVQVKGSNSADLLPVPPGGRGIQGTPLPEERPILVTPPKKEEK